MVLPTSISKKLLQPRLFSPHALPAAGHPQTGIKRSRLLVRPNPSEGTRNVKLFHRNIFTLFTKQTDSSTVFSRLQALRALSPPKAAQADTRHHHPKTRVGLSRRKRAWELGTAGQDLPPRLQAMTPNIRLVQQVSSAGTYFPNTSITEAGIPGE